MTENACGSSDSGIRSTTLLRGPVVSRDDVPSSAFRIVVREITIDAGSSTPVHVHGGLAIGVVQAGQLVHRAPWHSDGFRVYEAGEVIVEPAQRAHSGENAGAEAAVLLGVFLEPVDEAAAVKPVDDAAAVEPYADPQ